MDTHIERQQVDGGGGRYVLLHDDQAIGELDYRDVDGQRVFTHTGVRGPYEGQGLAARLVERGVGDARAEDREIVAQCWYVARWLERNVG
ncbi:MAG: GNAT family N-acetyltransferase [Aquihabitans sp.]